MTGSRGLLIELLCDTKGPFGDQLCLYAAQLITETLFRVGSFINDPNNEFVTVKVATHL